MGLIEQIVKINVREAIERVVEAKNKKIVPDMLRYTGYSIENVAFRADVPDSFVEKIKKSLLVLLCCCAVLQVRSQDSVFIRVHFLYGSKPLPRYRVTEPKWFGGLLGGHTGIEEDSDRVINFQPQGSFHWFAKKKNRHSHYAVNSVHDFYAIMDGRSDSVKKLIITIPVSMQQKKTLDSLTIVYLQQAPYDYALLGMRCGAAAYEILGQMGVVKRYSYTHTWWKILYPKKLRRQLLAAAAKNGWKTERLEGSVKRKWEKD